MLPAASPVQDTDDSASPCLRTRVCVCVSILCPLFLRVSLPSIYSFLSLFVCLLLVDWLFVLFGSLRAS